MSVAPPLKKRPTWKVRDDRAAEREGVGLDLVACWLVLLVNGSRSPG